MPAQPQDHPPGSPLDRFVLPLTELARQGRLRSRRSLLPLDAPHVRYGGRVCLNFCSNDYLGLAGDERLVAAFKSALDRYGTGAGASQLVSGYTSPQAELEARLAEFTGRERALVFGSGYLANLGTVSALAGRDTWISLDRLAHASLVDSVVLSRARLRRFAHNDVQALDQIISDNDYEKKLVLTESVFSMEGDQAPLAEMAAICRRHAALLYVDDAHGFGVIGHQGRGGVVQAGLDEASVPLMMATFGKALGVSGAFIAGPARLIDSILQHARTLIYTTALPPAQAVAIEQALTIVAAEEWRREHLRNLIDRWRAGADRLGLPLLPSETAIQPLIIGSPEKTLALSAALLERGFFVTPIRPPTVPEGSARLRITLTAAHQSAQVDRLLAALSELI